MPVTLIHEGAHNEVGAPALLTKDDDLTLEAQAISDFLTHADFGRVFEHSKAEKHIVEVDAKGKFTGKDAKLVSTMQEAVVFDELNDLEEGETMEFMLGESAAELIDIDDLSAMFEHYVDTLPDTTLEDKARLAAIANLYGITEKFSRGGFRKIARMGKAGHARVARMMLAMLNKGTIKRTKGSEGGYRGGGYEKGPAYKSSKRVRASAKQKIAKYKRGNLQKQKAAARKARVKMKEGVDPQDLSLFGFAVPVEEAFFEVATVADEAPLESTEKGVREGLVAVTGLRTAKSGPALAAAAGQGGGTKSSTNTSQTTLSEGASLASKMGALSKLKSVNG